MTIEQAIALHRAGRFADAEQAYRSLIAANPRDGDALHFYGVLRAQTGDFASAIDLIGRSLQLDPEAPQAHFHLANAFAGADRKQDALAHYERALALQPGYLQAQFGRIAMLIELGRAAEALALCRDLPRQPQTADLRGRALMAAKSREEALTAFEAAIALKPDFVDAYYHRAEALHALGRNDEALAALTRVLAMSPQFAEAHLAKANVLIALGRSFEARGAIDQAQSLKPSLAEAHDMRAVAAIGLKLWQEALEAADRAIALKPALYTAHLNRSRALLELQRHDEALVSVDRAIALSSNAAEAHNSRGGVLVKLGRTEEAMASFERALALDPGYADARVNRATVLLELDRLDEALAEFEGVLQRDPASAVAFYNLGNALRMVDRNEDALAAFDAAVALKPDWAEAHYNRADALQSLGRKDECRAACERALAIQPRLGLALTKQLTMKAAQCDWRGRETDVATLKQLCREDVLVDPFAALFAFDDPPLQLQAARTIAGPARTRSFPPRCHDRLRIAYLSPDFRDHAVAHQIVELLECHDRTQFEVFGVCLQSDADTAIRKRIKSAFEHFHEGQGRTDAGIAKLLLENEIDIAVDLAGYTEKGRTKALSARPAPIAVSYLGYSGTTGAGYVDYILADAHIIPPGSEAFYSENVVRLPASFFPTDTQGRGHPAPTRAEERLPENAFVFCTFNNAFKITPELFDIWMRLLAAVDQSVLWLRIDNPIARDNLRREAHLRGVSPGRLVFGEPAARERHLARIALADLFLDSTPYNAHTTCNDALWAGLPLVTCPGRSFASRVAAGMLTVSGAADLVAPDLASYERLALALARSPDRLAEVRRRLISTRPANPLFDMAQLCRSIENAYRTMWELHENGQKPRSFSVNVAAAEGVLRH